MLRRDVIAAAAMLLFAAAAVVESVRMLPYGGVHNPGPGFFPRWTGLVLIGLCLALLRVGLKAGRGAAGGAAAGQVVKVLGVLAVLGAYALLLDVVGYPIGTFLVVLFMLRVTERQPWPVALALSLLAAGGSYLVFAVWLHVPLPPGPRPW